MGERGEDVTDAPFGPLAGCRVLEIGSTAAGPFCARLMADFGADVIKIEPPEGDVLRNMGARKDGVPLYGASVLRGKRLIAVDMKQAEGRALARRLAIGSDVVIENYRPGTLEKWGLDYASLVDDNPGLVMVRISGYGQSGPYHDRPGYGIVAEAIGGLRELTGDPDRPPARVGVALTDYVAGLYGAFGAAMALVARQRTGRGQVVDAALYEAAFSLLELHVPGYPVLGVVPTRAGSAIPGHAPNNLYPTRDGGHVLIAAGTEAIFTRLCAAMGRPELARDPRFSTPQARGENASTLDAEIAAWTSTLDQQAAFAALVAAAVPGGPIYTMADIFADPHFRSREMLLDVPEPELGSVILPGIVPKLSETPGRIRWSGHRLGQDTHEILAERLGMTDAEIAALARRGVVVRGPGDEGMDDGS